MDVRAKKYTSFERYANDVSKLLMSMLLYDMIFHSHNLIPTSDPELEWNLIQYYTSHHEYMSYVEPFTVCHNIQLYNTRAVYISIIIIIRHCKYVCKDL